VNLIPQASAFCHRAFSLGREKVDNSGLVFYEDSRQVWSFLAHEEGDSPGIEVICLGRRTCASSFGSCPPSIDFVDDRAGSDQTLGEATSVAPGTFDAPLAVSSKRRGPGK
jgi:hypothetical protein